MGYSPENNPYIPGDPYSYDLKWIVQRLNTLITSEEAAARAEAAATAAADDADRAELAAADADAVLATLTSFVVPEMFGAVGDGTNDDTAAFQMACSSGKPVCLSQNKTYLLSDTITLEVQNSKDARIIFALGLNNDVRNANIICSFADNTHPVFDVMSDGFIFDNVNINAANIAHSTKDLTVFQLRRRIVTPAPPDPAYYPVDVDFTFANGAIFNANLVFNFTGRGLQVLNSSIVTSNHVAEISWPGDDGDTGTIWHDDATGMRAIRFENNRFHSIGGSGGNIANTWNAIHIAAGNAYGFRFVGNLFDRGDEQFLKSEDDAQNWIISDNTFSGMRGGDAFFWIDGDLNNVTFANNHLTLPNTDANHTMTYWLRIAGVMNNCQIVNNTVEQVDNANTILIQGNAGLNLDVINNCVISNNIISSVVGNSTNRGMIGMPNAAVVNRSVICGNVIGSVTGGSTNYAILRASSGGMTLNNVTLQQNIPSYSYDYSVSGGVTANNCKFDFVTPASTTLNSTTIGYVPTP